MILFKIKVEIFLEQEEVAFLSPSKIYENLNFFTVHISNSNFRKFCWLIRTQLISVLKLFLLYYEHVTLANEHFLRGYRLPKNTSMTLVVTNRRRSAPEFFLSLVLIMQTLLLPQIAKGQAARRSHRASTLKYKNFHFT